MPKTITEAQHLKRDVLDHLAQVDKLGHSEPKRRCRRRRRTHRQEKDRHVRRRKKRVRCRSRGDYHSRRSLKRRRIVVVRRWDSRRKIYRYREKMHVRSSGGGRGSSRESSHGDSYEDSYGDSYEGSYEDSYEDSYGDSSGDGDVVRKTSKHKLSRSRERRSFLGVQQQVTLPSDSCAVTDNPACQARDAGSKKRETVCLEGNLKPDPYPGIRVEASTQGIEKGKDQGNKLFAQGAFEESIRWFSKCIFLIESKDVAGVPADLHSILHSNRALAHIRLKAWAEAETDCSAALALNDRHAKAKYRRSMARLELGKTKAALDDVEAVLQELRNPKSKTEAEDLKKKVLAKLEVETSKTLPVTQEETPALKDTVIAATNSSKSPGKTDEAREKLEEWLLRLDAKKGVLLRYLEPLLREFGSLLELAAAVTKPAQSGMSVIDRVDPEVFQILGVQSLGHKLMLARAIAAVHDSN